MLKTLLRLAACSLLGAVFVVSCSEQETDAPTDRNVHPLLWMNPSHPANHGIVVRGKGNESCKACHGLDLQGSGRIPGCLDCHFDLLGSRNPAGSPWTHGSTPHNEFHGQSGICNNCHDIYREFGLPPASCHNCHDTGTSHPLGRAWMDRKSGTFHGIEANRDPAQCTACHGADFAGGMSGVSCFSCHFTSQGSLVPAGGNWRHGAVPHDSLLSFGMICNRCHDTSRAYGNGPTACHDCHATGASPHPVGRPWLDRKSSTFHGIEAGQDVLQCRQCHGSDYAGGSSGVSCNACHFGPTGRMTPTGSSWAHGTTPHNSLSSYASVCNRCHGLDRSYGNGPASCHDCHGSPPPHETGRTWLDSESASFHGIPASVDPSPCAACHGDDYRGGSSGVSCYRCHFGPSGSRVPQGHAWRHGSTPHESLSSYISTCNQCHNLDRSYGHGPSSCHDCHGDGDDD